MLCGKVAWFQVAANFPEVLQTVGFALSVWNVEIRQWKTPGRTPRREANSRITVARAMNYNVTWWAGVFNSNLYKWITWSQANARTLIYFLKAERAANIYYHLLHYQNFTFQIWYDHMVLYTIKTPLCIIFYSCQQISRAEKPNLTLLKVVASVCGGRAEPGGEGGINKILPWACFDQERPRWWLPSTKPALH